MRLHAIVVGKIKLAESDLIIKLLLEDGSKYEAVAKSARKPQGSLSSKVELFNEVELVVSPTRGLSIISECKLIGSCVCDRTDPNVFAFSSVISEYAQKNSIPNLPSNRLFDLIKSGYQALAPERFVSNKLIISALILKGSSIQGTRPILSECVLCSKSLVPTNEKAMWFSFAEGGTLCDGCATSTLVQQYSQTYNFETLIYANRLISTPFTNLITLDVSNNLANNLLDFSIKWLKATSDIVLKSLTLLK